MPYGTIKVDNITFTDNSVDKTVSLSGLIQNPTFTGNVTVTGTISGDVIRGGTTISGVTVTGTTANFVSGVFTTQVSGATIIATTGTFTSLTGTTTTGTTANFVSGVFTTQVSGATITGTTVSTTTGSFVSLTGTTATFTSGIIASGTAALPSLAILSDPNTGLFSPGADQVAISTNGTEKLIVKSDGKVGLGTSSPSTTLDVAGAISLGAVAIPSAGTARIFSRNTDNNLYIQTGSGSTLNILDGSQNTMASLGSSTVTLQTANSPRLTITSAGLVGIGNTTSGFTNNLIIGSGTGDNGATIYAGTASSSILHFADGASGSDRYRGGIVYNHANNSFNFATNDLSAVTIDSSQRLLVGTSTARSNFFNTTVAVPVQVEGTGTASAGISVISNPGATAGNSAVVVLGKSRGSSVGGTTIVASGDELGVLSYQGSDGTEFVEGARISCEVDGTPGADDMPGRLVFSTTLDGASSPTERMRLGNQGRLDIFSVDTPFRPRSADGAGTTNSLIYGMHSATSVSNGTNSFDVSTNGNVKNTNNSYGALSDIKLKENIIDATSQWSDIKDFQVRKYNFKQKTGQQTHTQIGLIAQEVELVSPGLVTESPDRDEEGNDLGTVTKSVNYSVLYMKAVKALQEAMERIEALESSNADMLTRLSALEAA